LCSQRELSYKQGKAKIQQGNSWQIISNPKHLRLSGENSTYKNGACKGDDQLGLHLQRHFDD
jgi:hypothetical protein